MSFSVNLISTAADCNLLLSLAAKEKSDLEFRKLSLERQRSSYAETAVEVETELQSVSAELAALVSIIASLPDGQVKDENITKQKKLELKQYLLTEKKDNYGAVALLEKEFGQARLEKELTATQDFITAMEARKAAL
jgi:hypothetical protein